ncbi:MAG: SelT/SelW/SelH family protein [Pseudomonadota bacterium]
MGAKITIRYCTGCRWLLRSAWMAQELLSTFEGDIQSLSLEPADGGVFQITVNDKEVWCRKKAGGFPAITELKQRVRDVIAPERQLGHTDNPHS